MNESSTSAEEAVGLFLARRRRGEEIDPAIFAASYPALGPEFASALASLAALLVLERATQGPDSLEPAIPDRVGPFRVVRQIGRGGMGVVLEAVEEPLGRRVALKMLPPELLSSPSARARFRREAELAARLDHHGIATIYGAGVADECPWIAMRFVEGDTLSRVIARSRADGAHCARLARAEASGRETALAVAACLARVARALQSAHDQGVVHRDIKPSNIIVAPDGAPVLLDFGLAIPDESDGHTLTRTGDTPGTPAYLAPEHVSGERARHDAQSDVYALGVTLYECLTLRRPFDAPTPVALYRSILADSPSTVRAQNRDVSRDLAVVVATAMERDRARRYRSAAALADDLEACVAGRPIAARPVPLHGRIARWIRREPRQAALAGSLAAATIALAVFGGSWWTSRDKVHAAERAADDERFEAALQNGFGNLIPEWHDLSKSSFERALAIKPGEPQALAGLALVEMYASSDAALAALQNAPATPEFEALRALARGEQPSEDHGSNWFLHATPVELFIDGMRLKKQLDRTPPSARPPIARLCVARFDEAIRRAPTAKFLYHLEWALAAQETHDEPLMRSAAAALVALWPNQEKALYNAATLLYAIDPRAAIPLFQKRIALFPEDPEPYSSMALAYLTLHELDAAQSAAELALARDTSSPWAYNTLAAVLQERGCVEEARAALVQAVGLHPPLFAAWANLAILEAGCGEPAQAEFLLRGALDLDPGSTVLRLTLVKLLAGRQALPEALVQAETVLGFDPENPRAWGWLADMQMQLENHAQALAAAEAGLEIAPDDTTLASQRDEAQQALASDH